jgi:rhodanese-related sulfurtransferase
MMDPIVPVPWVGTIDHQLTPQPTPKGKRMSKKPAHPPRWRGKVLLSSGLGQSVAIVVASMVLALAFNTTREAPLRPKAKIPAVQEESIEPLDNGDSETFISPAEQGSPEENLEQQHLAREITGDELLEIAGDGITLILDARNPEDYEAGHIPGAVNFPYEQFEAYYPSVSGRLLFPEQPIICYCEGGECTLSHDLASELYTMGYTNVYVLIGGFEQWMEEGREVVTP